ncbi:CT620/CT621 family type III secretion system effector [Chlamydiifrater phoenicopteri]|uniref:CT620/CT621 family type III secretion system effector n=1 Tax=Chlamydiifrater phoenicopteri TaxID=2681469 RepID=UPI001BCF4D4B|nr:CT620/CT621 family type III secretion system effector [Chlamydiifrater phoenicopteri]
MINSNLVSSDYKDYNFEGVLRKNISKESSKISKVSSLEVISGKKLALVKILHLASSFSNQSNTPNVFETKGFASKQFSPETIKLPEKFQKAFVFNYSLKSKNSFLPRIKSSQLINPVIKKFLNKEARGALGQSEAEEALTAIETVIAGCSGKTTSEELKKTLEEISTQAEAFEAKEEDFSPQDILSIWNLSLRTANTICRMGLPAAETLRFIEQLKTYDQQESLRKIFAQERLEEMISIVEELRDALSEEDFQFFEEFASKLGEMDVDQEYTEEQIDAILDSSYELADLINASKLSQNDKIKYNQRLGNLFEYQVELLKIWQKLGDYELALKNQQLSVFQEAVRQVESLVSIFAPVNFSSSLETFSALEASSALQTLLSINSLFESLSDEQKRSINEGLNSLMALAPYLGGVWAYFLASAATKAKPGITEGEMGVALEKGLASTIDVGVSLISKAKEWVRQVAKDSGNLYANRELRSGEAHFIVYKPKTNETYGEQKSKIAPKAPGDPVEINFDFMNRDAGAFLGSFASVAEEQKTTITEKYQTFNALANTSEQQSKEDIDSDVLEAQALKTLEVSSYQENSRIRIRELKSLALPSSIASVLIDHYMPREVDFLEGLYKKLYYSNLGSTVGNEILNAISGYINSGTFFNFASFVGQQPVVGIKDTNVFPGTKESAENRLKSEKEAAQKFALQTEQGLKVLSEQVAIVNNDPKITQEERAYIIGLLTSYENSLRTIASNLTTISNFLDQIKIEDSSKEQAGTFKVTGPNNWKDNLKSLEEAVVSGLPGQGGFGGMFNVQAKIQSDQQSFADMGQTYQLNLQMHLTGMQQEWTVVATSLQVLNQIYLGLARSLLR